ncbi:MAG: hypothetical protein KIS77_14930 [Saprospiraceae bacterium]|nr:hypothetical protein [Saprospiraceae bacterium]
MQATHFRLIVLLALSLLFYRSCCMEPPEISKTSAPAKILLLFCDEHVLRDVEKCADLKARLQKKYLAGPGYTPVRVELYPLSCNTSEGKNLLPNCRIDPQESDMLNEGSFTTKDQVEGRWLKDFANLSETNEIGCNQIVASLHLLSNRLRSISPGEEVRIVFITSWREIDLSNDFDRQSYRLLSNNPYNGGIYRFEESVLEEMQRKSNDANSTMRQIALSLKNTLRQNNLPISKVYCYTTSYCLSDDGDSNTKRMLDGFWDGLFAHAGLQIVRLGDLGDCLK